MSEESRIILEMVKDGKVSVEEAERLLDSVPGAIGSADAPTGAPAGEITPKRIRILVTEDGKPKVNLRIPFSLVRAGLKIAQSVGSKYGEEAEALKSIDADEILKGLSDGEITLPYVMIDVDDDEKNQHVEIVLE